MYPQILISPSPDSCLQLTKMPKSFLKNFCLARGSPYNLFVKDWIFFPFGQYLQFLRSALNSNNALQGTWVSPRFTSPAKVIGILCILSGPFTKPLKSTGPKANVQAKRSSILATNNTHSLRMVFRQFCIYHTWHFLDCLLACPTACL